MARYYTLVSSLPRLPYFDSAEWLPLTRKQLDQRLSMLEPSDRLQLQLSENLVKWQRQSISSSSEQLARNYRRTLPQLENKALRDFVEFRMAQRTAMVALRRQRQGLAMPAADEFWGVGPWLRLTESGWDRNDLGLGHLLPWIEEAAELLRNGAAHDLERLLMDVVWTRLGRIGDSHPFGFEPVFAFVFRWDILQRWMSYDAQRGKLRFQELVAEVTSEQQQLFT